jgi:hypothetical protein
LALMITLGYDTMNVDAEVNTLGPLLAKSYLCVTLSPLVLLVTYNSGSPTLQKKKSSNNRTDQTKTFIEFAI